MDTLLKSFPIKKSNSGSRDSLFNDSTTNKVQNVPQQISSHVFDIPELVLKDKWTRHVKKSISPLSPERNTVQMNRLEILDKIKFEDLTIQDLRHMWETKHQP